MILLIDNYDSFSYNLFQLVGTINDDIKIIRNDEMTVDEIKELAPSHIILSPGPKRPKDAGVCIDVVKTRKRDENIRRLPWASINLRSVRRGCIVCKAADARKAEPMRN